MFWYLATPYSRYPHGKLAAFEAAIDNVAVLLRAGVIAFSPIAHMHPIHARHGQDFGSDFAAWARFDEAMIASSRGVIVCLLDGWRRSEGIAAEVAYAKALAKPLYLMTPGEVPREVVPS